MNLTTDDVENRRSLSVSNDAVASCPSGWVIINIKCKETNWQLGRWSTVPLGGDEWNTANLYGWVVATQKKSIFQPYLGKWFILTHIFQMGWNNQLDGHFEGFPSFPPYKKVHEVWVDRCFGKLLWSQWWEITPVGWVKRGDEDTTVATYISGWNNKQLLFGNPWWIHGTIVMYMYLHESLIVMGSISR